MIACEATQLCTFVGFFVRMLLPALLSGAVALLALYLYFRNELPGPFPPLDLRPLDSISNYFDAGFGALIGISCLLVMSFSSLLPRALSLWVIALCFGALSLLKDMMFDGLALAKTVRQTGGLPSTDINDSVELLPLGDALTTAEDDQSLEDIDLNDTDSRVPNDNDDETIGVDASQLTVTQALLRGHTMTVLRQLPWKVIPFCSGMFVLVEIMDSVGWIDIFAKALSIMCADSLFLTVFVVGLSSTIACNLVNNQPMTIFFTRILLSPNFALSAAPMQGALYALVIGSNFGADFTIIGALAGLMWSSILKERGIQMTFFKFSRAGLIVMTLPLFVALLVAAIILSLI